MLSFQIGDKPGSGFVPQRFRDGRLEGQSREILGEPRVKVFRKVVGNDDAGCQIFVRTKTRQNFRVRTQDGAHDLCGGRLGKVFHAEIGRHSEFLVF